MKNAFIYSSYDHKSQISSVSLYDDPFSRYFTVSDLPIDSHVNISKCLKVFKPWPIAMHIKRTVNYIDSGIPPMLDYADDRSQCNKIQNRAMRTRGYGLQSPITASPQIRSLAHSPKGGLITGVVL